jgi:hypothetical protein
LEQATDVFSASGCFSDKELRVVCYFDYQKVYPQHEFRTQYLEAAQCTHIVFLNNVLNGTTLLHQPPNDLFDFEGWSTIALRQFI